MCKPSCAVWGLAREETCPDCLLDWAMECESKPHALLACRQALKLSVFLCPPFGFLRRELKRFMGESDAEAADVVDWVREKRRFYPPSSYAGGVARGFQPSEEFVQIGGRAA
jgi:hypothetical protein